MSISYSSEFSDVLSDGYVAASISVSTTEVEAKVGASALAGRETLRIYNNSNRTVYFGPSGVTSSTGEPILKKQWVNIPVGDSISVYLITDSGTASDVRIQEFA
jgi:hypothetical protein